MERLGTLKILRRYPVKSMAGEDLSEARVTFAGLAGDRVYAFVDTQDRSNFPWMTARQAHEMILFQARFLDAPPATNENPEAEQYAADVTTPEGERFRIGDSRFTEYLEKRFGRTLRLRFSERSMTDSRPISLFGMSTLLALSQESGLDLDSRRFRANFYVQWENGVPFFEDTLVGRELHIGERVIVQAVKKNARCVIVTLDPSTAAVAPQVLQQVAKLHAGCAGIYGAVLREGIVRAGDAVCLV